MEVIYIAVIVLYMGATHATIPTAVNNVCHQVLQLNHFCLEKIQTSGADEILSKSSTDQRYESDLANVIDSQKKNVKKYQDMKKQVRHKIEKYEKQLVVMKELESKIIEVEEQMQTRDKFRIPTSCREVHRSNAKVWQGKGGVFDIYHGMKIYEVYCDTTTDGGGWVVFQRRYDGSVKFHGLSRRWSDYTKGFGRKHGEFWLGLENVYQLTKNGTYELRVELSDWEGNAAYAVYKNFSLSGKEDFYRLNLGEYFGTAGDALTVSNKLQFTTWDSDIDTGCFTGIPYNWRAAWWFSHGSRTHLNGKFNSTIRDVPGLCWETWKGRSYTLKSSEMKFRKLED